jgi:hypothetical protein
MNTEQFEENVRLLMKTIDSCTSVDQLETAQNMVNLFVQQYKDNDKAPSLKDQLTGMIVFKEMQLLKNNK